MGISIFDFLNQFSHQATNHWCGFELLATGSDGLIIAKEWGPAILITIGALIFWSSSKDTPATRSASCKNCFMPYFGQLNGIALPQ